MESNPAAFAAAGRSSSGTSVNSNERFARKRAIAVSP
jgi:hypothetical protein